VALPVRLVVIRQALKILSRVEIEATIHAIDKATADHEVRGHASE